MRVATGAQMREIDRIAIDERGIPSGDLMEAAGRAAFQILLEHVPAPKRVVVVCGKGNNGGDGKIVARHLEGRNIPVEVVNVFDGDFDSEALEDADVVIDGVFGTGLREAPRGRTEEAIEAMLEAKRHGAFVLALDIPSGVNADDGSIPGVCVQADVTVTFGAGKVGNFSYPGGRFAGAVEVVDIGFPPELMDGLEDRLVEARDVRIALGAMPDDAHKGHRGKVLVVAGSDRTPGAAALAAEGALRAGAGLVTVATSTAAAPVVISALREAMVAPLDPKSVLERAKEMDAVVVGPGLGTRAIASATVTALLEKCETPMVFDADALNLVAAAGADVLKSAVGAPIVVTPHPGEMARLIESSPEAVNNTRAKLAREHAVAWNAVVVLKGARTVTGSPDGSIAVNPVAHPGIATAGSGDVLAGVVGALLASGLGPVEAGWCGAWLHGRAGLAAAKEIGPRGFLAREIAARIPKALHEALGTV